MARCLTDAELARIDAGVLPVLRATPFDERDELELCIGWASDPAEALTIMRTFPGISPTLDIPGMPLMVLTLPSKRPVEIGDKDGAWLPFFRRCRPGTYFNIEAYVPTYGRCDQPVTPFQKEA